jgi:ketosteroid isomerase-like protein
MKQNLIKFLILFIIINLSFSAYCQKNKNEIFIKEVLLEQEKAWNNGDITKYMNGYWNNDSLKFIGKSGIQYGWQQTLENYKKSYPDKSTMGILKFDIVKIESLSKNSAFVIGKWALTRDKGDVSGFFTLLFRIIDGKWLIVCDHSS